MSWGLWGPVGPVPPSSPHAQAVPPLRMLPVPGALLGLLGERKRRAISHH